jgi:hypothetical protein
MFTKKPKNYDVALQSRAPGLRLFGLRQGESGRHYSLPLGAYGET